MQIHTDGSGGRVFASPLARRLAQQAGVDLGALTGSGPHQRIVKRDVEQAIATGVPQPPLATAAPVQQSFEPIARPGAPAAPAAPPEAEVEDLPLSMTRKVVARRLTEAKQTVPHFYLAVDVELDRLLAVRGEINESEDAATKLSVNDLVIKATALALRRVPDVNVSFGGDRLYRYRDVDIAVAVAIPDGLITPIVRNADRKTLSAIALEMRDLAERARAGRLKPEEFQGGSFSISNLGMYGIKDFQAVINPPQAAILAVAAGEPRAVVRDGALAVATVMTATLSVDHRAIDGALAAEWLQAFKGLIERPLTMLV